MSTLTYNKTSIYKENRLLTILIVLKSTQASVLAFSPVTTILCLLYAFYIFKKRNLQLDKYFYTLVFTYLLINVFYYISFGSNDFYLGIYILMKLSYAYFTIKCIKEDFFPIFEKTVYILSLISLPLFVIQLIDYNFLFKIIGYAQNSISFLEYRNDRFANAIIFTLESHGSIFRNSGFAWEPKGFANFLTLAILINVINNKFRFNKRLIVMLIAMATTASTAGFLTVFIILPLLYFYNANPIRAIVLSLFMLPIFIYIVSLDIGLEKINREVEGKDEYKELLTDKREFETRSLGRFPSFIVDFKDAIKRPLFGYGFNPNQRTQSQYTKLVRVNGISDHFATFGFVGFFLLLLTYYKGFKKYLDIYDMKGIWIVMLIFLSIYFASTLTSHPFWMMFYFLFLIKMDKTSVIGKYKLLVK